MKERLTVDIIKDVVNSLPRTSEIISIDFDSNTGLSKFDVCNVLYARECLGVSIGGNDYLIHSVNQKDDCFFVEGDFTGATSYELAPVNYFHDSPYGGSHHISEIREESEKFPMIFLYEIFEEEDQEKLSAFGRISPIKIGFIDDTQSGFSRDERYSNRIQGLNKLRIAFREYIKNDTANFYTEKTKFKFINKPKYGKWMPDKGHLSSIFNEQMDGIDMFFKLIITDFCLNCKCDNC